MRMRTGYCGNISPRGSTSPNIRKPSSTRSRGASTNDRERRCTTKRQHNDFMKLLRRRVESATRSGRLQYGSVSYDLELAISRWPAPLRQKLVGRGCKRAGCRPRRQDVEERQGLLGEGLGGLHRQRKGGHSSLATSLARVEGKRVPLRSGDTYERVLEPV